MMRVIFIGFCIFILSGCVPYKHKDKALTNDEKSNLDKFYIQLSPIFINGVENYKKENGKYPPISTQKGFNFTISEDFTKKYLNNISNYWYYENHNNFYKVMSARELLLVPHTDYRQFDLISFLVSHITLGIIGICTYDNHYCHYNFDQGRLIYYGGDTSKIPLSEIPLSKSEEKSGITKEQKLQEILNCNSQIFLPENKQINTDKCYRGWYNEIIEN